MEVVKSYVPGLDAILGGGFPKDSITVVSGAPGVGKSTLGVGFLVGGIKKAGEVGLYITIEERKEKLVEYMKAIGWDLATMESLKQLVIIDYPPDEIEQLVSPNNPLKEIIVNSGITRVVIDSIVPIAISFENEFTRKKAFLRLVNNIIDWDVTTLIIGEDILTPPYESLPVSRYGIESLSDGWIHLYYVWDEKLKERRRALEVIKLKGMKHSHRVHFFDIDKGGIHVSSESME